MIIRRVLWMVMVATCLAGARSADAKVYFLQNRTEATITDLLYPWTQASACSCCVCWATALGTILSYWDDNASGGAGPWELLLKGGNGKDQLPFQTTTDQLYQISGVQCSAGFGDLGSWFNECGSTGNVATTFANGLGYSFSYDEDTWVWFDSDIVGPLSADHPLYYAYYPEGTGAHGVTLVGYDDSDGTLFLYKNWDPVVTHKGFDEAIEHCALEVLPGGKAAPPSGWTCGAAQYGGNDGCHCNCGAPDPDCDAPGQTPLNCPPGQICTSLGKCQGSCKDLCVTGQKQCSDGSHFQTCADQNGDGCTEWGPAVACSGGGSCSAGSCGACADQCFAGQRRCQGDASFEECTLAAGGCATWAPARACASPTTCVDGDCRATRCPLPNPECASAQRRCVDAGSYQLCDAFTADGCPTWGKPQACGAGTACSDGRCLPGTGAEVCWNEIDDDGNGLVDCEDPACAGAAGCPAGGGCACTLPSSRGDLPSSRDDASSVLGALLLGLMVVWRCRRRRAVQGPSRH